MSHDLLTRRRLFGLLLLCFQTHVNLAAAAAQTLPGGPVVLSSPARRTPDMAPPTPPPMPTGAGTMTALTIDVEVRRPAPDGSVEIVHQNILRTSNRVHMASGDGVEWLFERNPLDPRRAAGLLVRHATKEIVEYDESHLRTMMGIRGWADVVTLGFDAGLLQTLKPTAQVRHLGGIEFVRFASDEKSAIVRDVWWSDEHALPGEFVLPEATGPVHFALKQLRMGADDRLLRAPAIRFPEYRSIDIADWLEQH